MVLSRNNGNILPIQFLYHLSLYIVYTHIRFFIYYNRIRNNNGYIHIYIIICGIYSLFPSNPHDDFFSSDPVIPRALGKFFGARWYASRKLLKGLGSRASEGERE